MINIKNKVFLFDNFLSIEDLERVSKWAKSEKMCCDRIARDWHPGLISSFSDVYMGRESCYPDGGEVIDRLKASGEAIFEDMGRPFPILPPEDLEVLLSEIFSIKIPSIFSYNDLFSLSSVTRWKNGSGMPWHIDLSYIAAFTFFPDDVWDKDWGGEQMCDLSENNGDDGIGLWIRPRKNRLIISRDTSHKVSRISPDASDRITIHGFINRRSAKNAYPE